MRSDSYQKIIHVPVVGVEPTSLAALSFESSVFTVSPHGRGAPKGRRDYTPTSGVSSYPKIRRASAVISGMRSASEEAYVTSEAPA